VTESSTAIIFDSLKEMNMAAAYATAQ